MTDFAPEPGAEFVPLIGFRNYPCSLNEADEVLRLDQPVTDDCHGFRILVRDPEPEGVSRPKSCHRGVEHG
ncbi:hypothetical protein [Nisaea sediminum]|uniref:hypothetical protein n=1 Tax=Nisaea sediminum TaxID=2775867 RepID=UPI00186890D8|nr:hypothetical protein [Nisaea sediminum]